MARAIVIFGAAVGPDGRASPSLRRRTLYAAQAARDRPDHPVFCSGGVGRHGGSEASIMAEILLEAGVEPHRLVLDEDSRDTLENVVAAARFVRGRRLEGAVVCTDSYHHARVRMMFALLGVRSWPGPMAKGRAGTRLAYWLAMHARECAAYPYDLAIVLARRAELRRMIEA
jgi:uncharacterized SAM-binding protein YcdF (DUF218 family)